MTTLEEYKEVKIWQSIIAICLGAVAVMGTAREMNAEQENQVIASPEQLDQTLEQPVVFLYDDSETLSSPMPSVDMPPVTEDQRSRAAPKGVSGYEGGYQGGGNVSSN